MRRILLMALPLLLSADSLKSLLEYAQDNNQLIVSKSINKESKNSEVKSSENSYYPTIDVGGFYQRYDDASPIMPGTTYSAYGKIAWDIYDGGKKEYSLQQKKDELKASSFEFEASKKSIKLAIVQDFYNLKNLKASLSAFEESSNEVKAQLERIKKFFDANLATSDDIDRLQSAYDKNIYIIESTKFKILSLKKAIELKVGKEINSFDDSSFLKKSENSTNVLDSIEILKATKNSILNASKSIDSNYMPQVRIEDTYSFYGYMDEPTAFPIEQVENQNKIMLSLNMRVYDFGVIEQNKESLKLKADALELEIEYQTKEQKMNQELSLQRIKTANLNIKSSQSALKASSSALKTITEKYNTGIVDNVVYLDALSSQTEAKATYEESLNNLEISYALYYFYNTNDIEEFLSE